MYIRQVPIYMYIKLHKKFCLPYLPPLPSLPPLPLLLLPLFSLPQTLSRPMVLFRWPRRLVMEQK